MGQYANMKAQELTIAKILHNNNLNAILQSYRLGTAIINQNSAIITTGTYFALQLSFKIVQFFKVNFKTVYKC